ncbi:hypothetical protein ACN4EE_18725 [Geminocystis sp. CENA526]|uniref:hypothetical protein n=1 Tax=Geminocystis sp. CENA526 TaxID=1355871 RepID=UPI003D70195A
MKNAELRKATAKLLSNFLFSLSLRGTKQSRCHCEARSNLDHVYNNNRFSRFKLLALSIYCKAVTLFPIHGITIF